MKKHIVMAMFLLAGTQSIFAQILADASDNTKSQQQIMDEFNSRANIEMKVYPNPAINYLVVEPEVRAEAGIIKVMDVVGNIKAVFHLEPGSNGLNIDITQYIPGMYVLAYYDSGEKLLHIGRFYKN
jgi:hypothetical protein